MKFWNPFKKKDASEDLETKSIIGGGSPGCQVFSPYSFGLLNGANLLRNKQAWRYYENISPVFDAVDRKQKAMNTVKPAVFDTVDKVFYHEETKGINATKILPFLKKPNREKNWLEFLNASVASYEITGDIFIMVTATNERSEPLEFFYINPSDMTPIAGSDGTVQNWQLYSNQFRESFFYVSDPVRGISSYFTKDGSKELWQIKTFNPRESRLDFFGLSPLNPILLEIEQYEHSNIHNASVLKNGATPSGVLVIDKDFTMNETQYARMKEQVNAKYSGAENAGNILILDGGKEFKQLSMNNKDMDFLNLLKFVREQIYITKGIPLPSVTSSAMTMNNFEETKYMLYDTDVLPFANIFYPELSSLLMRRFDDSGRYVLFYDKSTIPALEVKRNEAIKKKIETNLLTINEGRTEIGVEGIDGGDVLLVQSTMVPLGEAGTEPEPEVKYDYTTVIGRHRLAFEEKLNENDERKFSDEDIDGKLMSLYGRKE